MIGTVRKFVANEVIPVASEMEHRNEYPHDLVGQMREMGLFGLNIPEEYVGPRWTPQHWRWCSRRSPKDGWVWPRDRQQFSDVRCSRPLRNEAAEAAVPAGYGVGRETRWDLPDRIDAGTRLQNISTTATAMATFTA